MLLALKIKSSFLAAAVAVPFAATLFGGHEIKTDFGAPETVTLQPGSFAYVPAGEFTRNGKPVSSPEVTIRIGRPLTITKAQISVGEYRRCVEDGVCASRGDAPSNDALPAVMISFRDAETYAAWLSEKLGVTYRLPTDEEWTFAAASRAPDERLEAAGDGDPIARWMARFERESQTAPIDPKPQPIGSFGSNERGLLDISGNVWEWTSTCFARTVLDGPHEKVVNCGVRTVEGRHRTYMSDFVRDPRGGGCAAGIPPSNLGFRLVREDSGFLPQLISRL